MTHAHDVHAPVQQASGAAAAPRHAASGAPASARDPAPRPDMDSHLAHDFAQVRIHAGADAARTWESLSEGLTLDGFASDSAVLNAGHAAQIDAYKLRVQMLLRQYPDSFFSVTGHTDATDSETHNQALGQQRAEAVKARLTSGDNAVPADRVDTGSLGETALAVPAPGREARNRRVEIIPTLRRWTMLPPPPRQRPWDATIGKANQPAGTPAPGPAQGPAAGPDPFGLRRPWIPDAGKPAHNWLREQLDREPLIRALPKWIGDKVKDALKDGDEAAAKAVIDALPIDDKVKAALKAVVGGVLRRFKGMEWKAPEQPSRTPDFGPQREVPKFPGEKILPGPTWRF